MGWRGTTACAAALISDFHALHIGIAVLPFVTWARKVGDVAIPHATNLVYAAQHSRRIALRGGEKKVARRAPRVHTTRRAARVLSLSMLAHQTEVALDVPLQFAADDL